MEQKETVNDKKINMIDAIEKFLDYTQDRNIKEIYNKNEKYIHFLYAYAERIIKKYADEVKVNTGNYIAVGFVLDTSEFEEKDPIYFTITLSDRDAKKAIHDNLREKIFIFTIFYSFFIFLEVIKCKSKNNTKINENNKKLQILNQLIFKYMHIVGNFYSTKIIDEEHLEIFFKFLIILSTSSSNTKPGNVNDILIMQCF